MSKTVEITIRCRVPLTGNLENSLNEAEETEDLDIEDADAIVEWLESFTDLLDYEVERTSSFG